METVERAMRTLEITIEVYDRQQAEISGSEDYEKARCSIDLDDVSAVWEEKGEQGGAISILLRSRERAIVTESLTYDEFVKAWHGDLPELVACRSVEGVDGRTDGSAAPCPDCGSTVREQIGNETTCTACGRVEKHDEP